MDNAAKNGLGQTVLDAVKATRQCVATNTNLGTVLLITPLAMVAPGRPLADGIRTVLTEMTADDAGSVYEAIRLAHAGGLGDVQEHDIAGPPPSSLLDAMRSAQDRDLIARQYANYFDDFFARILPWFSEELRQESTLSQAVIGLHLRLLCEFPDSLIARKCGIQLAKEASRRAEEALEARGQSAEAYLRAKKEFDFWLRADGHRRNPGTTADFVAAVLFASLRDGRIRPPFRIM